MNSEDLEACVRSFDRLVPKAARLHRLTWCVTLQQAVPTRTLQGRICCPCPHFVGNGGICDPL